MKATLHGTATQNYTDDFKAAAVDWLYELGATQNMRSKELMNSYCGISWLNRRLLFYQYSPISKDNNKEIPTYSASLKQQALLLFELV
jgi:hypothetical protein